MPFSIKRLTQVHRSTSLPNKNKHEDNSKDKKNKSSKNSEPSSSSLSSSSQSSVAQNKQKLSQLPGSRSIDAAEIRRLGGQLTISNPIPIDQPPVENNSKSIRWSKTGPHSAPRNLQQIQQLQQQLQQQQQHQQNLQQQHQQQQQQHHQQQQQQCHQQSHQQSHQQPHHDTHRSGYYSDAEDLRIGAHQPPQRRVMTLIRPSGHQPPAQAHQQSHQQQQHSTLHQSHPIRMTQQLPNLVLLKSGGTNSGRGGSSGATTGPQRPTNAVHNQAVQSGAPTGGAQPQQPQRPASTTPLDRFVFQPSSTLFDDDPGIMSEIETSATGFRRGGKVRSSLPIVRTPSKTQDRSLGLVFLQFRSETKRALLPNEITSLDTVKALFVRSFPRQLSMEYLDCPSIRIYIHDGSKDMFYELEDLRDIRDRCVLRIYEHGANGPQPVGGQNLPIPWTDSEQFGYFSEPEFESEYQSQHIHKKRGVPLQQQQQQLPTSGGQSQYYGTIILPAQYRSQTMNARNLITGQQPPQPPERSKPFPGYSQTLPRNAHIISLYGNINGSNTNNTNQNQSPNSAPVTQNQRPVSPDLIQKQRPKDPIGQMISSGPPPKPQRSFASRTALPPPRSITSPSVVGPQYHQNRPLPDRPYSVAGQYPSPERGRAYGQDFSGYLSSPERRMPHENQTQVRASFSGYPSTPFDDPYGIYGMRSGSATPVIDEEARVRMQAMERQIVSLTNVVTKALQPNPNQKTDEDNTNDMIDCNDLTNAQIQRQQFKEEKSVSFSDETTSQLDQLMHSPQRAAERPAKPAIKSRSTLTDKSGKPAPPPKPAALIGYRGDLPTALSNDMVAHLRLIRKKTKDLRGEVRSLRRLALQQTTTAKETLRDTCNKIKTTLAFLTGSSECQFRLERMRISTEKDLYGQDVTRLDKDLHELESQVEELRSNVINRRCRVNMSQVESMALVLSRASKTVADLKNRFPPLSQTMKSVMSQEMECCVREEKFLKEEPEKLEMALKRCKKLTGTLVTLKRLASVQEQRSTTNANSSSPSQLLQTASTDTTDASRAKRIQSWRRSPNFRDNVNNHKIDLWRGFASMPAMPEHNENQMYDSDLEPHTIIQVTPATPSAADSAKTNVLDTLLDELQTFSKPSAQTSANNTSIGGQSLTARKLLQSIGSVDSSIAKKGPQSSGVSIPAPPPRSSSRINPIVLTSFAVNRPPTYSAIRSNSEPNTGAVNRPRSTPPDGMTDGDEILVPPSSSTSSLSSVGSQGSVVEKRFAQSRQELLEQRHQELLKKQRQLQEQYTKLQQLSRGQIPRGLLNDLKKTGSESNIVSKTSYNMSAVHGSLRDLANNKSVLTSNATNGVSNDNNQQKIFETDIL